jgi:hypothetical protein
MSKWMQIDVRLLAVYGSAGLKGVFPRFAKFLRDFGYTEVLEGEPPLYQLVDVLVRIRNDPQVPENYKKPILQKAGELVKIRDEAREHLLGRRLNELDRALYRMEDGFRELEQELG